MSSLITVKGVEPCKRSLMLKGVLITKGVKWAIDDGAEIIKGDMEAGAPEDTGLMAGSILKVPGGGSGYAIKIGPSDDLISGIPGKTYPWLVEVGNRGTPANPFIKRAYDINIAAIKRNIRMVVKLGL
jgi:hypothetical protein